jgi:hypothetical protein
MRFDSKKVSLLFLAITAIACSRTVFAFINDPEGPNLLVVLGMAAVIYVIPAIVYLSRVSMVLTTPARALAAVVLQASIATSAYLWLR